MPNSGASKPLKAVALKFGQGNPDVTVAAPVVAEESEEPTESSGQPASAQLSQLPPLPVTSSAESIVIPEEDGDARVNSELPRSLQILGEIIHFAHKEGISDLQLQPEKLVYANGGGATRPYERWGKLTGDILPEILEFLYSGRTIFQGYEQEDSKNGDLWHRLITERKADFACEGEDSSGPLGVGRFRVQGHFSHQGGGITTRVLRTKLALFDQYGPPADEVESL